MGTEIDGHVSIGHDERVGVVRAAELAFADGIAAELIARQRSIVERQFHGVAAAVVDLVAESESTAAVGGDAADVVHGLVAGEGDGLDGDVIVPRDGARGLALGVAEGLGVVDAGVVGAGRPVAGEGGSVCDGVGVGLRSVEAVGDGERAAVVIAHEAGAAGGGGGAGADYLAVEHATANGDCAATWTAYDASVCAVALDLTFDDGADKAVLNVNHTPATAYKTTAKFARALDGASHLQVADSGGGVIRVAGVGLGSGYVAERGGVLSGSWLSDVCGSLPQFVEIALCRLCIRFACLLSSLAHQLREHLVGRLLHACQLVSVDAHIFYIFFLLCVQRYETIR